MTDLHHTGDRSRSAKTLQNLRRSVGSVASPTSANLLAAALLVVAALQLVRGRLHTGLVLAHDVYAYYFPNMLYAARQLHDGGGGLLWNPWQNCGEPFLANALVGLFYPPNWLFAVLDPDEALPAVLLVNAVVAALGSYALFRQFGAATMPAVAGAIAFLLGPTTLTMAAWSPIHIGSYCWLPVALLCTERLLANPTAIRVVALGAALTLALLPGYPQMTLFVYLIIGIRVLVQIVSGGGPGNVRALSAFGVACALPILFGAVLVIPYGEFWQESIRNRPLTITESNWAGNTAAKDVDELLIQTWRIQIAVILGVIALVRRRLRRPVLFFFAAGAIILVLAPGTRGPLGSLYAAIPGMSLFREPGRVLWLADICSAGLIALGLEAMLSALPAADRSSSHIRASATFLLRVIVAAVIPATLVWAVRSGEDPVQRIARSSESFLEYEPSFRQLQARMTPQDRAYLAHLHPLASQFRFIHKSASVFEVRSLFDYEPMTNRRYAEFFVMMRSGRAMKKLNDFLLGHYYGGWIPERFRPPMLHLVAGRYLVFDALDSQPTPQAWLQRPPAAGDSDLFIYENPEALPRASFVSRVRVVADPARLLQDLARGAHDPGRVALLEEPPPSGYLGENGPAPTAAVAFIVDDPEHLVIQVDAPRRGFLFLSDTYYPGWTAEVNGGSVPIQRANYAFRLVEVPQGRSTVQFRFRPTSLLLGAVVSAVSIVVILAALLWSRLRERRRRAGQPMMESR